MTLALSIEREPVAATEVRRPRTLPALTSIRFLAALHVALFHFVQPCARWGIFRPLLQSGYTGVNFFFVLSGFILTYSYAGQFQRGQGTVGQGTALKFWVARFARIYPLYFLCELVAAWRERETFLHGSFAAWCAHLLMVQSWTPMLSNRFNPPAWSLSVEAIFYLLFPFTFRSLRPKSRAGSLTALALLWLASLAAPAILLRLDPIAASTGFPADPVHLGNATFVERWPPFALPEFLFGVVTGWYFLQFGIGRAASQALFWSGCCALFLLWFVSDSIPVIFLHNGLLMPAFCAIILGLAADSRLTRAFSHGWMVRLGEASYALYLCHGLILMLTHEKFGMEPSIGNAVWRLGFAIPLSLCLHGWVERPARTWILRMCDFDNHCESGVREFPRAFDEANQRG